MGDLKFSLPGINKIAIALIIAFLVNMFFTPLLRPYLLSIFNAEEFAYYSLNIQVASIIGYSISYLVNIVVAIWVFSESGKQNESRWVWALFALFFGLIAVIAFYMMLLIKEFKLYREESSKAS